MIKNLIFDYGAVLIDWNRHYFYDSYFNDKEKTDWFLDNICTLEWNNLLDYKWSYDEGIGYLVAKHPEWEKEIRAYKTGWLQMIGGQIPGMEEYIRELKARGYKTYGLTNFNADNFLIGEKHFPIFSLIDNVVVSGREHLAKPDPAIYELLLSRHGLDRKECIFIDDNETNVKASNALGLKAIQFTGEAELRKQLEPLLEF